MPDDESQSSTSSTKRRTDFVSEQDWKTFAEFKAGITGRKGEGLVERELARLGFAGLHDVILPDARGVTQIDHLVLTANAIIVIETKTYGGHVTGERESAQWVQHLADGQTRNTFQNPLRQNHRHCRAVAELLGQFDVVIRGTIVFAGKATFCDDLKDCIIRMDELRACLSSPRRSMVNAPSLQRAWQRLAEVTAAHEGRRDEHRAMMDRWREFARP